MAITKEQLFATADAIEARGETVTLEAIRQALGVTANGLTDVMSETEAMNAWKAHKTTRTQQSTEPAPRAVAERVTQFGSELWALALQQAHARLAPERKALEAVRAELETQTREARSEATQLRAQWVAANESAATASARADGLERRAVDLQREITRLNDLNQQLVDAIKGVVSIAAEPSTEVITHGRAFEVSLTRLRMSIRWDSSSSLCRQELCHFAWKNRSWQCWLSQKLIASIGLRGNTRAAFDANLAAI
jgi:hypothetical protein